MVKKNTVTPVSTGSDEIQMLISKVSVKLSGTHLGHSLYLLRMYI